ncbi:restriction endonuclease subunit S [Bifidobacterium adolescentis]|uniref:restriction endonuclease subunit S n=1 Tax=Bifidobacterium adolescentis TaxID=1680 RepID=UPI002A2835E8|nr:restriction endonuclease subunit S [Bifidobacterium adolescentis]
MAEQHEKALVPQIRFAGFTDPWEQRKLGELFEEHSEKDRDDLPALTIIQGGGTVHRDESNRNLQFDRNSLSNYKVVDTGDFIVHLRSFEGGLEKATCCGLVSPAYHIFRGKNVDSDFYYLYFRSKRFIDADLKPHVYGIRDGRSIDIEGMKTIFIPWTNLAEQRRIGAFFDRLDSLITLHQRKYDKLCVLKKSMLDKMFPKGGSLYPEIRFAGFTDPWEQRKLSELVEIERGGSPRPIERYITDDPCGLNWVKIGDAPELGRYITQTTEKIKPEGLAKTRQVYPGDLVLSNSMSFGRPYIMAIKGCIHDGWLLIRDAQKHFDPIFLCHMLGAPQMLNQYRMFAAGSTVNNLNKELVGKAIVSLPSKDEQREIGIVLDRLDSLITLHQRKLELLRNIKKSMLDKMFV